MLPNGDVLVAETNAPPRPEDGKGIKGWFIKRYQKKAGGAVPSANRITLLRDADGDGVAETRTVFLDGLNSPFGMALVGDSFYVANTDAIVRFPTTTGDDADHRGAGARSSTCRPGRSTTTGPRTSSPVADGAQAVRRPSARTATSPRTAWTRRRAARRSGRSIARPAQHRVFASGLRNPGRHGLGAGDAARCGPSVNERDELGSDLVPDYMTSVRDGGFYGWPYSYFGQHVDTRVKPPRPDLVAKAIVPDYALGPHTASLGLAFARHDAARRAFAQRHVRRPARLVEPQAAQRLQGDLRAVRGRQARRASRSTC